MALPQGVYRSASYRYESRVEPITEHRLLAQVSTTRMDVRVDLDECGRAVSAFDHLSYIIN